MFQIFTLFDIVQINSMPIDFYRKLIIIWLINLCIFFSVFDFSFCFLRNNWFYQIFFFFSILFIPHIYLYQQVIQHFHRMHDRWQNWRKKFCVKYDVKFVINVQHKVLDKGKKNILKILNEDMQNQYRLLNIINLNVYVYVKKEWIILNDFISL